MEVKLYGYYKRVDNGRSVKVIDLKPNGATIFAVTQDELDGHTTIINTKDLRPLERQRYDEPRKRRGRNGGIP